MTTLTVQVDSNVAEKALLVAERRQTTLDALVQSFLQELANEDPSPRRQATEYLLNTIEELSRPMGGKPWRERDELYER